MRKNFATIRLVDGTEDEMADAIEEICDSLRVYYISETGFVPSSTQFIIKCFYTLNNSVYLKIHITSVYELPEMEQYIYDFIISKSLIFLPERQILSEQMGLESLPEDYVQKIIPIALKQWKEEEILYHCPHPVMMSIGTIEQRKGIL